MTVARADVFMSMSQHQSGLPARVRVPQVDLVERRLRRYAPAAQGPVRAVAARHARLADLAVSFPALLFGLARPRAGFDPEPAIAGAVQGWPLAEVAQAGGVPLWLRRIPFEGLVQPLPPLPDSGFVRRRIANHLPRSPRLAPIWLGAVATAAVLGHELLAIWIARELTREPKRVTLPRLRLISLWAWYSSQAGTFGHRLIEKRWRPPMRFASALEAAEEWRTRIALAVNIGDRPIADMWLTPDRLDGYDVVPLDTIESIADEAAAMNNCLRTYGYNLAHNRSRLWGIRKDGKRIATLRVGRWLNDPLVRVRDLRLVDNKQAPAELWWMATRWLNRHNLLDIDPKTYDWGTAPLDRAAWHSLWRPYWLAKRSIPSWLPLKPCRASLDAL